MVRRGAELAMARILPEYAVYKGEDLIAMGTARECAEQLGVKLETFRFYRTPKYKRRVASRKFHRNCGYKTVVKIDVDDEE